MAGVDKKQKKTQKEESQVDESVNTKKSTKKQDAKEVVKKDGNESKKVTRKSKSLTKVSAKKVAKKVQSGGDEEKEKKSRSFKALYVDPTGNVVMEGRYCGAKPKQAACKALSGIYKTFKEEGAEVNGEIKFGVKECTRGSKCKFYWYSGERVTLDEPITLKINKGSDSKGKEITYYYNNVVKKEIEDNCKHLLEYNEESDELKKGSAKKPAKDAKAKPAKKEASKGKSEKSEKKQEKVDKKVKVAKK